KLLEFFERLRADMAFRARRAREPLVVKDYHMPVLRELAVDLDHIDAALDRFFDRRARVLGTRAGAAAMRDADESESVHDRYIREPTAVRYFNPDAVLKISTVSDGRIHPAFVKRRRAAMPAAPSGQKNNPSRRPASRMSASISSSLTATAAQRLSRRTSRIRREASE